MSKELTTDIIRLKKKELGADLLILAHHYQCDEVVYFADYVGDSFELARKAAENKAARIIVFCGVYFMAETASILAPQAQVFIPDVEAGCPLADMAKTEDVEYAWSMISPLGGTIPLTYVNSSAAIKAFCGSNGGAVCTSGNAQRAFDWAFSQGGRIFFMPDRNLGRNTARALGIPDDAVIEWDPEDPPHDMEQIKHARVVLWKGWCPVHWPTFEVSDINTVRSAYPDVKVIVHPECDPATVAASDIAGSTAKIVSYMDSMGLDATVAIGTEINMVNRLSKSYHGIADIIPLRVARCEDMSKISMEKLALCLDNLTGDKRVRVADDIAADARLALDRMLRF